MSRNELTGLSYVVLELIGRNGASPHDLVRMARSGQRLYWAGAESKIYEQPRRLEHGGYVKSEKRPGRTRQRTYYTLTDKGIAAFREWLPLPTPFPRIQSEAAIRVQGSDLAEDPALVLESLGPLGDELADLDKILDEAELRAPAFPHREVQLRLLRSLGRRLLRAHREWISEVEQELGAGRS
jgi:PadR family transcriptional regulator AphA